MKTFLLSACVLCALVVAAAGEAQTTRPSFDCSKAETDAEKLICGDDDLAELDARMARVYEKALENYPADELSNLKAYQRGWAKGRDECWKDDDLRKCLELAYRTRIAELQIQSGQLEVPAPVGFRCDGIEGTRVVATFYNQTDPPSAVITVGDDQVIAFRAPAASGAKYTAANVVLWEKGGDATLEWFGETRECKAQ